jgi:hypothetical protein
LQQHVRGAAQVEMIALRPLRPEKKNPAEAGLDSGYRRIPDCLRADGEASGSP